MSVRGVAAAGGGGGGGPAISAGTQSVSTGTVVFSNSNSVSFGMSGSNTITASFSTAAQTNQTVGIYASSQTFGQSSSSTVDARSISFVGQGELSVGMSAGSVMLSNAPAQRSYLQAIPLGNIASNTAGALGNATIVIYPIQAPQPFTASQARVLANHSLSTSSNSSWAVGLSFFVGLYTQNVSTLSLASSGSQSYAFTITSNISTGSYSGIRNFSVPINVNYSGGQDLFVAFMSSTTTANTLWATIQMMGLPQGSSNSVVSGSFGAANNNSAQIIQGLGYYTSSSVAFPAAVPFNSIIGAASVVFAPNVNFMNLTM